MRHKSHDQSTLKGMATRKSEWLSGLLSSARCCANEADRMKKAASLLVNFGYRAGNFTYFKNAAKREDVGFAPCWYFANLSLNKRLPFDKIRTVFQENQSLDEKPFLAFREHATGHRCYAWPRKSAYENQNKIVLVPDPEVSYHCLLHLIAWWKHINHANSVPIDCWIKWCICLGLIKQKADCVFWLATKRLDDLFVWMAANMGDDRFNAGGTRRQLFQKELEVFLCVMQANSLCVTDMMCGYNILGHMALRISAIPEEPDQLPFCDVMKKYMTSLLEVYNYSYEEVNECLDDPDSIDRSVIISTLVEYSDDDMQCFYLGSHVGVSDYISALTKGSSLDSLRLFSRMRNTIDVVALYMLSGGIDFKAHIISKKSQFLFDITSECIDSQDNEGVLRKLIYGFTCYDGIALHKVVLLESVLGCDSFRVRKVIGPVSNDFLKVTPDGQLGDTNEVAVISPDTWLGNILDGTRRKAVELIQIEDRNRDLIASYFGGLGIEVEFLVILRISNERCIVCLCDNSKASLPFYRLEHLIVSFAQYMTVLLHKLYNRDYNETLLVSTTHGLRGYINGVDSAMTIIKEYLKRLQKESVCHADIAHVCERIINSVDEGRKDLQAINRFRENMTSVLGYKKHIRQTFELQDVFESVCNKLHAAVNPIKYSLQSIGSIVIKGDKNVLISVLDAVVQNSLEAIQQDKELVISLNCTIKEKGNLNRICEIAVTDNGPGIPEIHWDLIFTPGFTTKSSGSGLGLPTGRQMMKLEYGGNLLYDQQYNEGARFLIHIPL